jgi:hypothetical protein
MATVLNWNGEQLPDELRKLPRGRYVIEAIDEVPTLTDEQEDGIVAAADSIEQGRGVSLENAKQSIDRILGR